MNCKFLQNVLLTGRLSAAVLLLSAARSLQAQHIHVNAGATSPAQDAPLYFANGDAYATNALYDVYLSLARSGSFSNLYQGAGVTFTALASTPDNGGPAPGHAAEGSFLQLQFVALNGPAGGEFGVWMQEEGDPTANYPLFTLPVGVTNGANLIALSESDGSPGADPYGHIHGRTFTVTKPGLYTLGCRLVDTSNNGPSGRPIHQPSPVYSFYFQAGSTISSWAKSADSFAVTFGTTAGQTYSVEAAPDLAAPNWTPLAGRFIGNNRLLTAATNSAAPKLFFRLRSD